MIKKIFYLLLFLFVGHYGKLFSQNFGWAKQIGGTGTEVVNDIITDAAGNIYTTGTFGGTVDFDPGPSTYTLASAASNDIFISKIDGNGSFLWAVNFGTSASNAGNSITLDPTGNIYITGYFQSIVDFDPGPGTFTLMPPSTNNDIFILKLDAAGNFVWAKQISGFGVDLATSLAIDASNNIYVTGSFQNTTDFDPGIGTFNLTAIGGTDIFLSKLDLNGNFVWAINMGGISNEQANAIALDASGNIYTTGFFQGTSVDFDPGISSFTLSAIGNSDIFISKLNSSGSFIWAKQIGGTNAEQGYSIATDITGNVYTTGYFQSTYIDFDPSAATYTLATNGSSDIYINKLDGSGNFVWANQIGGTNNDVANAINVDASSNVYITGYFQSTSVDFDPSIATYPINNFGSSDVFITKFNTLGNFLLAFQIAGTGSEIGRAVTTDTFGNLFVAGSFQTTTDFDPGAGTYTLSSTGFNLDMFVCKLTNLNVGLNEKSETNSVRIYPNPSNGLFSIELDKQNNNTEIEITNIFGQLISVKKLNGFENTVEMTEANKGVYFLKVIENNTVIETKKIVLE